MRTGDMIYSKKYYDTFKYLLLLLFTLLFPFSAFAQNDRYDKISDIEVFIDQSKKQTIETVSSSSSEIRWDKVIEKIGYTEATVWARFKIPEKYKNDVNNTSPENFYHIIFNVLNKGWPKKITYYDGVNKPVVNGHQHFENQPTGFLQPIFRVKKSKGFHYFSIESTEPITVNFFIATKCDIIVADSRKTALIFIFVGALLISLLYNFAIYYRMIDRVYVYFSLFVFGMFLLEDALEHFTVLILDMKFLAPIVALQINFSALFMAAVLFGFCRLYLKLKEHNKTLDSLLKILFYVSIILMVLNILFDNKYLVKLVNIPTALAPILTVVISIKLFKKMKEARILLFVVGLGLITLTLKHLTFSGIIDFDNWGYFGYSSQIMQILLFSYGISEDAKKDLVNKVFERTKALNNANLELERIAITDPLTGVNNRRYFEKKLTDELNRAERYSRKLSLAMIDVDYFKKYNDRHGHIAGDGALKLISKLFSSNIRVTDFVSRYGGEEFVITFPETEKAEAKDICDRIRLLIEKSCFPHKNEKEQANLTVSFGIALYPDDASDFVSLVDKADEALYVAKNTGRNQIILAC